MKCLKCGKPSASPFCTSCNAGKLPAYVYAFWKLDEGYLVNEEEHLQKKQADSVSKKNSIDNQSTSKQSVYLSGTDNPTSKDEGYYSRNTDNLYQNYLEAVKRYNDQKKKEEAVSQKDLTNKAENKRDATQTTSKKESLTPVVTESESKQSNQAKQNKPQIDVYANTYSTKETEKSARQERSFSGGSSMVDAASPHRSSSTQQTSGMNVSPKRLQRTSNNANNRQKPETQTDSHKSGLYYHFTGRIKEIELTVNIFDFFLKAIDCVSSYAPYQIGSEAYECEFELKSTDNNSDSQNHTFVFYGDPELIRIADEVSITAIKRGEKYYITKIFNVKSNKRIKPKEQISSTLFVFLLAMVYTLLLELFGLIFLAISPSLYHNSNYPLVALIIGIVCYLWWVIKYYRDKTAKVPPYKNNPSE